MNKKFKKIMVTTLISMTATSAIGCASNNTKIAKKINGGVNEFVSSINKLDYVETNNNSNPTLGKIVSATNEKSFYTKMTQNSDIENTITRPSERTDNFKLYILSESPYISLTSDDNNINISMQLSTEKIETVSDDISEKINQVILKRAILMIYVNEIYSGNISLTTENRKAINAYVNIIKENASYLNGNRGMVKNQLGMANDLINNPESENNIVNYYIIKSGEALEVRSNKIESTLSAIDSIISILEQNLTPSSCYYQNNLTSAYENMITKTQNANLSSEDEVLAKNIADSIDLIQTNKSSINENLTTSQKSRLINQNNTRINQTLVNNNSNNSDCKDCIKTPINNSNQTNINNRINNSQTNSNNQNKTQEPQTLELNDNNYYNKTRINSTNTNRYNSQIKTQNTLNNDENISNNTNNGNRSILNQSTTRARRLRERQRLNNQNSTLNSNSTNQIQNHPTPSTNIIQSENINTNRTVNNTNNSINENNRVSRVPYRTTTNNID